MKKAEIGQEAMENKKEASPVLFKGSMLPTTTQGQNTEGGNPGAATSMEAGTTASSTHLPHIPGDTSRVLTMNAASFYDMYSNIKSGVSNRLKTRIMTFMRHDIDNNRASNSRSTSSARDVEGGNIARGSNVTYDSLIFKITLLLGFLLQFPVMWVAGSIIFLSSNNFKTSTIKWGCMNIILSILSFVYVTHQWHMQSSPLVSHKDIAESFALESGLLPGTWESGIFEDSGYVNLKRFTFYHDKKWEAYDAGNRYISEGVSYVLGKSDILVDPRIVNPGHNYYCCTGDDLLMVGYVQFGAVISNETPADSGTLPFLLSSAHTIPLIYSPHSGMIFDVGMRCASDDNNFVFIGVNASGKNSRGVHSRVFYLPRLYTCTLAYGTEGPKPVVHSAYIKTL